MVLTLRLPFPREVAGAANDPQALSPTEYDLPFPPQIAKLRFEGLRESGINLLIAWCGGQTAMAENMRKLNEVVRNMRVSLNPLLIPFSEAAKAHVSALSTP